VNRRPYIDWLRGIAVLIMIEAHTLDSWTRVADRSSPWYRNAIIVAGFGAPLFLFLAGVASVLAAGARTRKGLTTGEVALAALRRGAWIFLLAFLFRLQSLVLGGGQFPQSLLKVDILNVMGVSMIVGAIGLALARTATARLLLFMAFTAACAMLTPLIRETPLLSGLPDPLEAYLRPLRGLTTFTLFPWAGFFFGGCLVGMALEGAARLSLRVESWKSGVEQRWLALAGAALAVGGYLSSYLPPLFPGASFWTSSPTFFFLRFGVLVLSVPVAFAVTKWWRGELLQEFGRASLFVYWVHVELVYGVLTASIHRRLSLPVVFLAFAAFTVAMFGLVRLKTAIVSRGRSTKSMTAAQS
jgi:uncharacterized membrane protein